MTVRSISYASRIFFGEGALSQLPAVLAAIHVKRPLLVCDAGVRGAGIEERVVNAIAGVPHETRLLPIKLDEVVLREIAREAAALRCDGLIAVGGGSVIDAAKMISLCMATDRPLAEYSVDAASPRPMPRDMPGVVCVPTTSGTGSDLSRGAAVHSGDARLVIVDHTLVPKASICDPVLTIGLPATITAATAVDALTHCLEGYLSPRSGPPFDALALAGIKRIIKWLPVTMERPDNLAARSELMMGAIEGGISMQLGLGIMHGLAVPLDGPGMHHGTMVGILAPHVLNFYERHGVPRMAELREVLHLRTRKNALGHVIGALISQSGLPLKLSETGVTPDLLGEAVRVAPLSSYHGGSPVQPTPAEYRELIAEAM